VKRAILAVLAFLLIGGVAQAQTLQPVSSVTTTALAASIVLKAGSGYLYDAYATNLTGGSTGYLLLINGTTVPSDGALTGCGTSPSTGCLMDCAPFQGGVAQLYNAGLPASVYNKGIVAVVSSATTCYTLTTGVVTAFISGKIR
jgi:hypothetical protein